jgi:pimeloyl-ACP methyl ester carboxylesterase
VPFLTVNDAEMYYEVDGVGPPLVLVMGLGGNSQVWAPIRRQLASRYQLILYDMQGTGRSPASPLPTTRETLLNELDALLAHLGLERVLGLGYSFGSSVLLSYAARSPERLSAISLVAGLYNVTPQARAFFDVQTELSQALTRSAYIKQAFLWLCSETFFEKNPEFFERMISFLERSPRAMEPWGKWKQFIETFDSDYRDILRDLSMPTQIVHGSADKVSWIKPVRAAAEACPAIQLDVIPDGGHMLPWDAPEATIATLLEFYGKHDQAFARPAPAAPAHP